MPFDATLSRVRCQSSITLFNFTRERFDTHGRSQKLSATHQTDCPSPCCFHVRRKVGKGFCSGHYLPATSTTTSPLPPELTSTHKQVT